MTLRVAITRAQPEAEATAVRVREAGGEPVLAPLLSIAPLPFDTDVEGVQALLFSSANGIRAFAAACPHRGLPTYTVGDASAAAAREAGMTDVRSADGDVGALAALAQRALDPRAGKVLHISGAHVAGDLVGALRQAGFAAERRVAYEARAATAPPEALLGRWDVALFHSARAAETFIALGAPGAATRVAACMSPAVANAAAKTAWSRIVVAPRPRENDLLDAVFAA